MRENLTDRRRALVVDDNRAIHDDFRKVLCGEDEHQLDTVEALFLGEPRPTISPICYDVADAYQGEEAVAFTQHAVDNEEPFDVAFVDMRMPPGCDGLDTVEMLWEIDPDLPIVICSSHSDCSWLDLASRLGQNDRWLILKKPFEPVEVAQAAAALSVKRREQSAAHRHCLQLESVIHGQTAELKQANEEAERLLGAISSMLVGIDSEHRVSRWNGAAEETFGVSAAQAVGCKFVELPIHWCSDSEVQRLLAGGFGDREELTFEDANHQIHILGAKVCPIHADGGMLLIARDITQLRQTEQQLSQVQRMEAIGHLAAGVAHEINTPMQYLGDNLEYVTHILERVQPLLDRYDEILAALEVGQPELAESLAAATSKADARRVLKSVPEALADSRDGVNQVARIVRGLKEFSHPNVDQRTTVDINHCVESTITVSRNEWKYVANIQREYAPDLPRPSVFAGELNQVFLNLLVNAAHAVAERTNQGADGKGRITIQTQMVDSWVEVLIQDNGVGMPPQTLDRAFQPFFTTKPMGQGTGQGLAFARKIVEEKHAGKIWIESTPGEGTRCYVRIPCDPVTESEDDLGTEQIQPPEQDTEYRELQEELA